MTNRKAISLRRDTMRLSFGISGVTSSVPVFYLLPYLSGTSYRDLDLVNSPLFGQSQLTNILSRRVSTIIIKLNTPFLPVVIISDTSRHVELGCSLRWWPSSLTSAFSCSSLEPDCVLAVVAKSSSHSVERNQLQVKEKLPQIPLLSRSPKKLMKMLRKLKNRRKKKILKGSNSKATPARMTLQLL